MIDKKYRNIALLSCMILHNNINSMKKTYVSINLLAILLDFLNLLEHVYS